MQRLSIHGEQRIFEELKCNVTEWRVKGGEEKIQAGDTEDGAFVRKAK